MLNFMIVGHTKFSPDRHFGTIKKLLKNKGCSSILDLVGPQGLVEKSTKDTKENKVMTYLDFSTGLRNFEWYEWDEFLRKKFRSCQGIRSWHLIKSEQRRKKIQVANCVGSEYQDFDNEISHVNLIGQPNILQPNELSPTRTNQLKHFESYVTNEHKPFILSNF